MSIKTISQSIIASIVLSAIASLSTILAINTAFAADLTINVSNIQKHQGNILVALYANQQDYKTDKAIKNLAVPANADSKSLTFKQLTDGEYAVKLFQDENSNGKMDFNMFGMPQEGYGFSNNGGRFGQPKYQEAKIVVKNNTTIAIKLR